MKKKALEFLEIASEGPITENLALYALLGIGYAILALVEERSTKNEDAETDPGK